MSIALLPEPVLHAAHGENGSPTPEAVSIRLPLTEKRLRANRRNARKSTGPKTPEGKARSSKNALTHGVFTDDMIVEGEDEQVFRDYRLSLMRGLNPHCPLELEYAEQFIQASWKLRRLQSAEASLFEDRFSLAQEHQTDRTTEPTTGSIMAEIFAADDRALERLQIYQRRLQAMRDKAMDQIQRLQTKWPNEPRSEFLWQLLEREGAATEQNGKNEATDEANDATDEGAESLATDGAQIHTDKCREEGLVGMSRPSDDDPPVHSGS